MPRQFISQVKVPGNEQAYDLKAYQSAGIYYAQVDGTSTSKAFTVTIPELTVTEYYDGLTILLYNGKVTSESGFTINVNGLGAKPSYSNMTLGNPVTPTVPTRDTTIFNINYAMLFIYNSTRVSGGCWICYRGYDANTNTVGYQLRTNSYSLTTLDAFRYYKILFTSADNQHWVPAASSTTNSATSKKTPNSRPINPFGEIVYCGNSTSYAANAAVSATACWQEYTVALGYSFNTTGAALTLTSRQPVYVKCTPQANGSAIIDANIPIVQTLPSTADGAIYILLGIAYSATNIELLMNHPIYYYKEGAIRLWTHAESGLPGVSASDNGKLLTVVNGEWAPATKPSYTANEVGALPSDTTYVSSVNGQSGAVTVATPGTLNTTATTAQTTSASELLSGNITLHKISKTGNYNDLTNKPTDANGIVPLANGGTGLAVNNSNWYSGDTLHPRFEVLYDIEDGGFSVRYTGPLDGISDITDFYSSDYFKAAVRSLAPMWVGAFGAMFFSTAMVMTGFLAESDITKIYILFPDAISYYGQYVNGLKGTLELDQDGVYMRPSTMQPLTPGWYNPLNTLSNSISSVGYSGSYNDLTDQPSIPSAPGTLNTTATMALATDSSEALSGAVTLHKIAKTGTYSDLIGTPTLGTAAAKNTTNTYSATGTDPITGTGVAAALATLPTPMQFKGTIGTGGTIQVLPPASPEYTGWTYKVITAISSPSAKVGDVVICNGASWVVVPSGDEPSGTVTNVAISNGGGLSVSGSPITSSGTITISHADTSSQASVNNSGRTYIQNVTLDEYGHVTGLSSATETVTDTNTTYTLNVSGTGDNATKVGLVAGGSGSGTNWYTIPYATTAGSANSVAWANVSGHAAGVKADIGIATSGSTFLRKDGTWVTPTDTNTTYSLSGALSSHKFTSTLTAGGSGSGTSTTDLTLAAGSNITLTDDTSNRKITIAATDTNTTYSLAVNGTGDNANKLGLTAGGSGSGTVWVTVPYATTAGSAPSEFVLTDFTVGA